MDKFDLDLNTITYEWVEKTNDTKLLKKALQMLKDDGGYFPDLDKTIDEKLQQLDKKYKQTKNVGITLEEILKVHENINNWEKDIKKSDQIINENKDSPNQSYQIKSLEIKKQAENEKIKGNEMMKTKEYDEAVRFYTRSIEMDSLESTTYCNRALAYIQLKQFNKALDDCEKALKYKKDYIKAYYRRAICYNNLRKFNESFKDFLYVLNNNPQSNDILNEIMGLKSKWKKDIGDDSWERIENDIEEQTSKAKKGEWKDMSLIEDKNIFNNKITITEETINDDHKETHGNFKKIIIEEETIESKPIKEEQDKKKEGFQKIKIEEEDDVNAKDTKELTEKLKEENSIKIETIEDISEELKKKYDRFIESGEQVKLELKKKIERKEFKASEAIAHHCYLDCEKFIKKFKSNSIYFNKIDSAMKELKSLLAIIRNEMSKEEKGTQPSTIPTSSNPVSSNTKETPNQSEQQSSLSSKEDIREKATKIAEQAISFTDFSKNTFGFEKAYNSFKSQPEVFYQFLKYFNGQTISQIYKNTQMSNTVLAGTISVLLNKNEALKDNYPIILDYLTSISKTKNFSLVKNFIKKAEKSSIVSALNEIKALDETKSDICNELIKAYS